MFDFEFKTKNIFVYVDGFFLGSLICTDFEIDEYFEDGIKKFDFVATYNSFPIFCVVCKKCIIEKDLKIYIESFNN